MSTKLSSPTLAAQAFLLSFLKKIVEEGQTIFEVVGVVTQPDKPVGRKHIVTACPVKTYAIAHGIKVMDIKNPELPQLLASCDIGLVFAFGEIIRPELLRASKHGLWNIHPSALPLYRGPAPVAMPLILGESECSISLIQLDEILDHGPIIAQKPIKILPEVMHKDLLIKMAQMSYYMLFESVQKIRTNSINLTAQKELKKTYTYLLSRESGYIALPIIKKLLNNEVLDKNENPEVIRKFLKKNPLVSWSPPHGKILLWNMYRALHPWPGIWTEIEMNNERKRLKIIEMSYNNGDPLITKMQIEGKNSVPFNSGVLHEANEMSPSR
ncbi:MAG: Methionyl-tRNA formyltransferase [Microgenomates bacterium OLB23]|nr:MAG: Methionyl-tRNA formyltransferase [Microgenomates bacterium OLB23]